MPRRCGVLRSGTPGLISRSCWPPVEFRRPTAPPARRALNRRGSTGRSWSPQWSGGCRAVRRKANGVRGAHRRSRRPQHRPTGPRSARRSSRGRRRRGRAQRPCRVTRTGVDTDLNAPKRKHENADGTTEVAAIRGQHRLSDQDGFGAQVDRMACRGGHQARNAAPEREDHGRERRAAMAPRRETTPRAGPAAARRRARSRTRRPRSTRPWTWFPPGPLRLGRSTRRRVRRAAEPRSTTRSP